MAEFIGYVLGVVLSLLALYGLIWLIKAIWMMV